MFKIADIAKQLFKRVEDEKLLRGKPNESIIAACIFIACRQYGVPRTFKEICTLTQVPKKEIGRCFKALNEAFQETKVQTMTSEDLMARFCSNLNLPMEVQKSAVELTKRAKDIGNLAGKSPVSIAAACIYMGSHLFDKTRSTRDISVVCGVSEVTIKNAYKHLYGERNKLIDDRITAKHIEALPTP